MEPHILTRLGDGSAVALTRSELRAELEGGTQAAVARAKVPSLAEGELQHLLDVFASRARFSAVDIGDEVVLTFDGTGTPQQGSRVDALLQYEQCFASDTCELYHIDYSYKAVKTVVGGEQQAMKEAQERVTIPVHYGAQPDLGRYSAPDGPCGSWSELLPQLRLDEAREAQEAAVAMAVDDMVFVAEAMWAAGADGINFDTAGAGGDADLLATLLAVERLRAAHAHMGIMVGMAGEMVLGTHGQLEYAGTRLAGLKPAGQLQVVQLAGATVFGPAVNVNTSRTVAWNIARALTFMKPCMEIAEIPVHANVGMGVGGVPMNAFAPVDAISRCSRACVDILHVDGLQVGSGDSFGMPVAHAVASGMNGLRAAGDLVARLEMTKGMRLTDAKQLVALKLGTCVADLADPLVMHEVRGDLRLGRVFEAETTYPHDPSPQEAKLNIAALLGVPVNGVARLGAALAG